MALKSINNPAYFRYHIKAYRIAKLVDIINNSVDYIKENYNEKGNLMSPRVLMTKYIVEILGAEYSTINHNDLENLIKGVKKLLPKSIVKNWYDDKRAFDAMKKQVMEESKVVPLVDIARDSIGRLKWKPSKKYLKSIDTMGLDVDTSKARLKALKKAVQFNKSALKYDKPIVL
jgi:hypothetical protein